MKVFVPTKEWLELHMFYYGMYNTEKKWYRYSGHMNWFYDSEHHMEGWFIWDSKFYPKNEGDVLNTLALLDRTSK